MLIIIINYKLYIYIYILSLFYSIIQIIQIAFFLINLNDLTNFITIYNYKYYI